MADAKTPAIELMGVDVTGAELRSNTIVVHNVDWQVSAGDYWVVGGLPGAGKTDLLVTAAGLQKPGAGTHLLFGNNLAMMEEGAQLRERLRVGIVFQGGGRLFHQLSITENLALPICYHENIPLEEARERVKTILHLVGLSGMERRRPGILTRNIHQRVALARALMLAPEVLLFDNPLGALDPRQVFWWLDFLPRLAKGVPELMHRKMTLVVTTDDFRPWREQGTHFALVHEKQWSIIGGRAELEASQDPAVRDVLEPVFQLKES